ncbi:MAG: hydroxymethylbilane synthase [Ignavibacteria bacterium]|jgi:hydroxymethylbilane synthase
MKREIVIGSRGSELALWQTNWVKSKLRTNYPELTVSIEIIKTKGDKVLDTALSKIGDKGLFTKEIEQSLLDGKIDLAVHSLKDLPTEQPEGLVICAVTERAERRDAFISNKYPSLVELPEGAVVATGSLRRRCQLLNFRDDLKIVDIRGNVLTRLRKFEESSYDGLVLAYAGLLRLSLEAKVKHIIPTGIILPAAGQGVMAIETRQDEGDIIELVKVLHDEISFIETTAERSFLRFLEGGCQVPIGICSEVKNRTILILEGMIGSLDGKKVVREQITGGASEPEELGKRLAQILLDKGGKEILEEIRSGAAV